MPALSWLSYRPDSVFSPLFESFEQHDDSLLVHELTREGCLDICIYVAMLSAMSCAKEGSVFLAATMEIVFKPELKACFPEYCPERFEERTAAYFDLFKEGKSGIERLLPLIIRAKAREINADVDTYCLDLQRRVIARPEVLERDHHEQNALNMMGAEITTIVIPQIEPCAQKAMQLLKKKPENEYRPEQKTLFQKLKQFGICFVCLFCGIGSFGLIPSEIKKNEQISLAQSWKPAAAYFKEGMAHITNKSNHVKISYSYDYQGKHYESTNVGWYSKDELKKTFDSAKHSNRMITCYVNPDNPSEAVIFRNLESKTGGVGLTMMFLLGIGLSLYGIWGILKLFFPKKMHELWHELRSPDPSR